MNKILTIIEGEVAESQWGILKDKYESFDKNSLPSSLLSSHLIQDINEPEIWRIVTIWESLEEMKKYRASVETPAWILVFKTVNAEPKLVINEIILSK
jgi:hypothetical protein